MLVEAVTVADIAAADYTPEVPAMQLDPVEQAESTKLAKQKVMVSHQVDH